VGMTGLFHCPVCRAKFRGTRECLRCGADLAMVMILPRRAQLYRESAKKAMYSLDFEKAHDLAIAAQQVHATETGRRLLLLTTWLTSRSGSLI
jgi:hypothetical protein